MSAAPPLDVGKGWLGWLLYSGDFPRRQTSAMGAVVCVSARPTQTAMGKALYAGSSDRHARQSDQSRLMQLCVTSTGKKVKALPPPAPVDDA